MAHSHSLRALLESVPAARLQGNADVPISSIATDSRAVEKGSLFVALRGQHQDGNAFIADALERGAVAVVTESDVTPSNGVAVVNVADSAFALSKIADAFYGSPSHSMTIAGVTGTNGKTTTTHFVASIMREAGIQPGIIGTIGAHFLNRSYPLANTTPPAAELQALLAQMRDSGTKGVALEVSSHALALHRVTDVRIAVGALTNLTRDHLDFHGTFEAYAEAKHSLFQLAERCVFNADDGFGNLWSFEFRRQKPTLTYATWREADVRATGVELAKDGSSFKLDGTRARVRLPGRYNVSNALCAIAVARSLGIDDAASFRGIENVELVSGRMERIEGDGVDVIVDYAHTPDALEKFLRAVRETKPQRLVLVFGCGGDRDRGKRRQMGEIAGRYADFTYVTSDNPRTEDPRAIIEEILPGIEKANHAIEIDRRTAIERAIRDAQSGDVIAIAGKGHEKYQIVGEQTLPFDDAELAREALRRQRA